MIGHFNTFQRTCENELHKETIDAREDYGRWALEREDIMDRAILTFNSHEVTEE